MPKISSLRQDPRRIHDGDWIAVGFDPNDLFRIKTRGSTPKFQALLRQLNAAALREANKNPTPGVPPITLEGLPAVVSNGCLGRAMAEETFLDVDRLDGDDGKPVTRDQFRDFLLDPETYPAAISLAYQAVLAIHTEREREAEATVGNSLTASGGA